MSIYNRHVFYFYFSFTVVALTSSLRASLTLTLTLASHVSDGSFSCVVKNKDDGQTKFIKPNSQRQDIIIKYWVSIGSIHREQG